MASQVKQIRRRKQMKKQQANKSNINRNVKKTVEDLIQNKSTDKVVKDMMKYMIMYKYKNEIYFNFSTDELTDRCFAIYSCYMIQKDNDIKRFVNMCLEMKKTNKKFFSHLTLPYILTLSLIKYDKDVTVDEEKYKYQVL